jgi:hypothetical protein
MEQRFRSTVLGRGPRSAWVFVSIPFDVASVYGTKGRVPVKGTINGFPFRKALLPEGDGTHAMVVCKELQAGAKVSVGDEVEVILDRDTAERTVDVPAELTAALAPHETVREIFESLAYSHRKEYADWVGGAKKEETRKARSLKAVEMLRARRRVK